MKFLRIERPKRSQLGSDLKAGLVLGIESVPDGLATGLLAAVNPAYGLYAYMVGALAGALTTSSVFMCVQGTGAMSAIVSDIPGVRGEGGSAALFTLSVLTGVVMLALGLLRLGKLVRFVPGSVITGFINAVAINIILGQLANLTGYASDAEGRVLRAIDTVLHPGQLNWASVALGALTIAMILTLEKTRVGELGMVVAVVVAAALAALVPVFGSIATLSDIAEVPATLPRLTMPQLRYVITLLPSAFALALVGLVQGAGVSSAVPNPDGKYPDASGDFTGQGVANIASGLLQGMPVGGSMSGTAVAREAGAKSRWALVFASAVMAASILIFGGMLGQLAMPSLAALLMLVGWRTLRPDDALMVWKAGDTPRAVMGVTLVLTLAIPLQYAVLAGVGLSIVLYVVQQSNTITVVGWRFEGEDPPVEEAVPTRLGRGEILVLQPYGSLFFAAAQAFEEQLPEVDQGSEGSVVILRLRGESQLGSTFIAAVDRYAARLREAGGRLMLAGLSRDVVEQLDATGVAARLGHGAVFAATPRVLDSVHHARRAAEEWQRSLHHGG